MLARAPESCQVDGGVHASVARFLDAWKEACFFADPFGVDGAARETSVLTVGYVGTDDTSVGSGKGFPGGMNAGRPTRSSRPIRITAGTSSHGFLAMCHRALIS